MRLLPRLGLSLLLLVLGPTLARAEATGSTSTSSKKAKSKGKPKPKKTEPAPAPAQPDPAPVAAPAPAPTSTSAPTPEPAPAPTTAPTTATTPPLMVPGAAGTHVEIDVARQVLFFVRGGALFRIVPVSTGSGQRFCVQNQCDTAVTPGGAYRVYDKYRGWQTGNLGKLYSPSYFNGGIAVHGYPSVPTYNASHGCVRIPMHIAPRRVSTCHSPGCSAGGVNTGGE